MKKYSLTPEHKEALKTYKDQWIANALSTQPMTDEDKEICIDSVNKMYQIAGLKPPKNIVFVSSPFILRFAGAIAKALWEKGKEVDFDSILSKIKDSPEEPDLTNWYVVDACLKTLDKAFGLRGAGVEAAKTLYQNNWQGGNQWSGYVAYLSFFKDIIKLDIDYSKYEPWELLCKHSGPRIVAEDFCMISDRPKTLLIDQQNRPHCTTGPFCEWRDGSKLYSVHGVRVPAWIIEKPNTITFESIEAEENLEVRRVMIDLFGEEKYLLAGNFQVIHSDVDQFNRLRRLLKIDVKGDEPIMKVEVINSTKEELEDKYKTYYLAVDFELRPILKDPTDTDFITDLTRDEMISRGYLGKPQKLTCHNAVASTFGKYGEEYGIDGQTRQGDVFIEMKTGASTKLKFRES